MKVLVVEDDVDQLNIRALLLRRSGFEVFEAGTRFEARRLAAFHYPDCAVMDLNMPTVSEGLALIRDLKLINANMHVIVLTGADTHVFEMRSEAALVDQVFKKPAVSAQLIRKLKAYA
jgi:DNA-binding response OmpR family regulator